MNNVAEEMEHLYQLAKRDPQKRFNRLWKNLISTAWLMQAWEQIRNNRGSQTAGVTATTAIDVDLELIHKLAGSLKDGRYRPKPVRRVLIPKSNGKLRPLGIPALEDRIVQQALKMLLEPIFEADFLTCSHGFRQGLSTHTALRDVAHAYSNTSWIIEADIQGCYDNIPHGQLVTQLRRRIADEKVLQLIWRFLRAGYLEDWQYHKSYSGVPQGGILSPLLSNVFLHQLDTFVVNELEANRKEAKAESNARRDPEYMKITHQIGYLRKKLKKVDRPSAREIIKKLAELERQRKRMPSYAKDKKHPCKVRYVRYADDFVCLIAGNKQEAAAITHRIREKLSTMGLSLNEEKTKLTHWRHAVLFLGYQLQGVEKRGNGIRIVFSIPRASQRKVEEAIKQASSYYHAPEVDAMAHINAIFRGWCNYYKYANPAQRVFSRLAWKIWWCYAHFLARKQKASIAAMIRREVKAGRLKTIHKQGRTSHTFHQPIGKRILTLDLIPPRTGCIKQLANRQEWKVDLKPVDLLNWQSGRSLATRLEAEERAGGICEKCREKAVTHVHHLTAIRERSFLARIMSDRDQRQTAIALCLECHLEIHGGSFQPGRTRASRNAGYIERCSSSVGSAE
jgi:group II intron reverse transcriptase/maturase